MMTKLELKRLQNQTEIFKIGIGFNWIILSIAFIVLISMLIAPISAVHVCNYPNGGDVYDGDVVICTSAYYTTYSPTNTGCGAGELGTISTFTMQNWAGTTNYVQRADLAACPPPIYYQWHRAGALPTNKAYATFIITNSSSFANKLSNVSVVLSNGQSVLTSPSGVGTIRIIPNSSTLTYSLTKTGYVSQSGIALGGYGEFGGTLYLTMTPDTGIIPPGSVRTYFQNVDTAGHHIQDSNLQLKDLTFNVWHNWTTAFDGTGYIDALPTSRLSGYGTATGYSSASRINVTPGDFVYEIIMIPTGSLLAPGDGYVNLIAVVNDRGTGSPIDLASISTTIPTGAYTGTSTSSSGTAEFVVPNMSVIHVAVSKTGYKSASKVITTTAFGPDTVRIELDKHVVTATVTATPQPGELTPRPTYIAGCEPGGDPATCAANMDQNLWVQLREQSGLIMSLALIAVIMGLVKIMGK